MLKKITMRDMLKAGVHFGHQKAKYNPKMKPYVFALRNNVHIIDLEQTVKKLAEAQKFIKKLCANKSIILFVGTKRQAKKLVQKAAQKVNMPYVIERWLGGTFTNFKIIAKQIEKLKELEEKQKSGELKKYTKKEQLKIDKEIKSLQKLIGGIKMLNKLPDAVFIVDVHHDALTVKEANEKNIPIIALTDTNTDPSKIDYPIPSNDDAIQVIQLMLEQITHAIKTGNN